MGASHVVFAGEVSQLGDGDRESLLVGDAFSRTQQAAWARIELLADRVDWSVKYSVPRGLRPDPGRARRNVYRELSDDC